MITTTLVRRILVLLVAVTLSAGLGACREDERNRPLTYEKGQYTGKKGSELNEEQLRTLRQRHRSQSSGSL